VSLNILSDERGDGAISATLSADTGEIGTAREPRMAALDVTTTRALSVHLGFSPLHCSVFVLRPVAVRRQLRRSL
jgi:hypothetical protein